MAYDTCRKRNAKKFPAVIEIAAIAVSILLGIVVFAFSDRSSNTTLVFGVQIALPIASFMPIVIALSASSNLFKLRIFTALSAVLCIASLVINRETGVPIMLYIAFTVWYLIFCPTKNKLVTLIVVAAPIIGIIGMFLYGKIIVHIIDIGFLTNIYNMIHDRVFSDDLYQINCAVSSIQRGSFFGINSYSYVPEGTSDLLFTTVLHYLGAGFLVLFSALLIPFVVSGAKRFTAYGYGFTSYLSGLSFVLIITFSLYNLLMCVGAAPIIGIQQPFMGFSGTQALFSGILLGSCTYPKGKIIFAKQA